MDSLKKPLIGITTGSNPDYEQPWKSPEIGQRQEYVDAVVAAGGVPVLLPISTDTGVIERLASTMDGFLFAGGNDIDPVWYGEENHYSEKVDYRRDAFEVRLLEQIEKSKKPVLAICRGMQILNVSRGGTMYQDISSQLEGMEDHKHSDTLKDPAGTAHNLEITPGSFLEDTLGVRTMPSNSRHHQAVRELGGGLVMSACAADGIIEAIEDPSRVFMLGIQSHPESMRDEAGVVWSRVFSRFIKASSEEYHHVIIKSEGASDDSLLERDDVTIIAA